MFYITPKLLTATGKTLCNKMHLQDIFGNIFFPL